MKPEGMLFVLVILRLVLGSVNTWEHCVFSQGPFIKPDKWTIDVLGHWLVFLLWNWIIGHHLILC